MPLRRLTGIMDRLRWHMAAWTASPRLRCPCREAPSKRVSRNFRVFSIPLLEGLRKAVSSRDRYRTSSHRQDLSSLIVDSVPDLPKAKAAEHGSGGVAPGKRVRENLQEGGVRLSDRDEARCHRSCEAQALGTGKVK